MDLANLLQGDELIARRWLESLLVDPFRSLAVPEDFEVVLEFFRAHRAPLLEKLFDFAQHERVALDRGRVVCLEMPETVPESLCFVWFRETAVVRELIDCSFEPFVHGLVGRPAPLRYGS